MLKIYSNKSRITDLSEKEEFFINNNRATVIGKRKGGIATVVIAKININDIIRANIPFGPYVALKQNNQEYFQDSESINAFKKELVTWSLLRAPNLAPLSAILEDQDESWIAAMPYYMGTAYDFMRNRMEHGYFHLQTVLGDVCTALTRLQMQKVVHHDIKPSNILYRVDPIKSLYNIEKELTDWIDPDKHKHEFVLSDFGTASIYDNHLKRILIEGTDEKVEKINDGLGGTIPYMPPERFLPGYEANSSADLYSLGITSLELLTGSLPFKRGNIKNTIHQIITGEYYENAKILLKYNKINKKIAKAVLGLIEYDPHSRKNTPFNFLFEYTDCLKSVYKTFFGGFSLKYLTRSEYVASKVQIEQSNDDLLSAQITEEDRKLSCAFLLRDIYKRRLDNDLNEAEYKKIKDSFKLGNDELERGIQLGGLFEMERISYQVDVMNRTGHSTKNILKYLKEVLLRIDKTAFTNITEDSNAFSYCCSHFVIPRLVNYRGLDLPMLFTSVFPLNIYLYFHVSYESGFGPERDCTDISYFYDWLNSDTYYYMVRFQGISDKYRKVRPKDDVNVIYQGKHVLGCFYAIILYNNTENQYHCITIGNSASGLDVRTSHEWARITKRYYQHTIPTTDCEMPFKEVYGEAKMSEKDCLTPENILKFLKDNVAKIFES